MYENKGCLQQKKRQLILKTSIWLYSKYRCNEKDTRHDMRPLILFINLIDVNINIKMLMLIDINIEINI